MSLSEVLAEQPERRWSRRWERDAVAAVVPALVAAGHLGPHARVRRVVRNRNTTGYRLDDGGRALFLKLLVGKPAPEAAAEHAALVRADGWAAARVPRAVAAFPEHGAVVMEYIEGAPLKQVLRAACRRGAALPPAVVAQMRDLGRGLRQFHRTAPAHATPAALLDDLASHLDRVFPGAWRRIERALPRGLASRAFEAGPVYGDYEAANALVDESAVVLLEPPSRHVIDHVHRDLATFHVGLWKAGWHPWWVARYDPAAAERLYAAFLDAYADGRPLTHEDRVLVRLWEIARLAGLRVWARRVLRYRGRAAGAAWWAFTAPVYRRAVQRVIVALEAS